MGEILRFKLKKKIEFYHELERHGTTFPSRLRYFFFQVSSHAEHRNIRLNPSANFSDWQTSPRIRVIPNEYGKWDWTNDKATNHIAMIPLCKFCYILHMYCYGKFDLKKFFHWRAQWRSVEEKIGGIKFDARKTYSAVNYFPAFYIVFCYIPSKKKMIIIFPITFQCKIVHIFEQVFVRAFWGSK